MSRPFEHSSPARGVRQAKVRIVRKRHPFRTAGISVGIAIGAAVLVPLAWTFWRGQRVESAHQRTWGETEITWRCERNHTFLAIGQDGSRVCWICGAIAYPVANYYCEVHGAFEFQVQFGADETGTGSVVKQVRRHGGKWLSPEVGLKCPRCGRELFYAPPDPLQSRLGRKHRPGG